MIDIFESTSRFASDEVFFTFIDRSGQVIDYTYKRTRLASAALARYLNAKGLKPGSVIVADLPNCPEYVILVLAAAYAGFTVVSLDHALAAHEKQSIMLDLSREGLRASLVFDMSIAHKVLRLVRTPYVEDARLVESICSITKRERSIMGEQQDIVDDTVHFAEREAHLFDMNQQACILYPEGMSGKLKAVPLTWAELTSAAVASNRALAEGGTALWQAKLPFENSLRLGTPEQVCTWQCVLPLHTIAAVQVIVRSVVGRSSFLLYEDFDAERVLKDGEDAAITHIAVTDSILQDLLTVEEWREEVMENPRSRLSEYQCILVADRKMSPRTIERAQSMGARVFSSYGMAETSGMIACALVTPDFMGGLKLLDDYAVRIVDADDEGFGKLAVQGPGVFAGYLNASAAFTVDRFFMTGDTAAIYDGRVFLKNRTARSFTSRGQTVYPEEISDVLRHVPGVSAAHVFGVADAQIGRRVVAVIERSASTLTAEDVERRAHEWLAGQGQPDIILVVDALPRNEHGKVNRASTEEMFRSRIQVRRIILRHIRLPLHTPMQSAQGVLNHRDVVIVQVEDALGRVGLGECVSCDDRKGSLETLPEDVSYIAEVLSPALIGRTLLHPREAVELFAHLPEIDKHALAQTAIDAALWDLYGQAVEKPLWRLLNEEYLSIWNAAGASKHLEEMPNTTHFSDGVATVPTGAIIGMGPTPLVMEHVREAVAKGHSRVKMKIAPGKGFASVEAARRTFPDLLITLDANRSFGPDDIKELKSYDALNVGWIEEPFALKTTVQNTVRDPLAEMNTMQTEFFTPFCVDESYSDLQDALRILKMPNLHVISIKVAKFGGIRATLEFIARAKMMGRVIWMGGTYGTGVSRRMSAAFETLPDMVFPGDIASTLRYFDIDITTPVYDTQSGDVSLNNGGFEFGLGCTLDEEKIALCEVNRIVLE